jgi:hypothetical protein
MAFRFFENVYPTGIVKGTVFITVWGSRIFTVLNVLRQCPLVLLVILRLQQGTALGIEEGKAKERGQFTYAVEERG